MYSCPVNWDASPFGENTNEIHFGDSAIGTGVLFLALRHYIDEVNETKGKNYFIASAIGVDIDEEMAKEAFIVTAGI